jgi:hypothetical protein
MLEVWWKKRGGLDATVGLKPPLSWLQTQSMTR